MADPSGIAILGYDGSEGAQHAIRQAAGFLGPRRMLVLTVYEHLDALVVPSGVGAPVARIGPEEIKAARLHAEELAGEGAELARAEGFEAESEAVEVSGSAADTILRVARKREAVAVVVGSRGLGSVGSALLGSVSSRLVHHADRPLAIVPQPS
jgi:nucleotide-binding universal stress UspA family protein